MPSCVLLCTPPGNPLCRMTKHIHRQSTLCTSTGHVKERPLQFKSSSTQQALMYLRGPRLVVSPSGSLKVKPVYLCTSPWPSFEGRRCMRDALLHRELHCTAHCMWHSFLAVTPSKVIYVRHRHDRSSSSAPPYVCTWVNPWRPVVIQPP